MEEEPKYEVPYAATNVQTSVKIEMPKRSQVEKTSKFSRKALTRTVPWVLCVFFSFLTTCILLGKIIVDDARLDYLTKLTERQQWLIPYKISINCTLARSHNLMQLSNGKKYFFSYPTREYWSVANEKCKEMGLHLATLRDEADLDATWTEANKRINGTGGYQQRITQIKENTTFAGVTAQSWRKTASCGATMFTNSGAASTSGLGTPKHWTAIIAQTIIIPFANCQQNVTEGSIKIGTADPQSKYFKHHIVKCL